jgi:hypothetical protein
MSHYGGGKSFMLGLCKNLFIKRAAVCSIADLGADKRFYASGTGYGLNLYREVIRNLSTSLHPDGGALEEILNAVDEKMASGTDQEFQETLRRMPFGYDALTCVAQWGLALHPTTEKEKREAILTKDAVLRWFSGEATTEHRRKLGVRALVGDETTFDAIRMLAMLVHYAGYSGLHIMYDEVETIFRINNTTSRERNYLSILTQLNATLQGDAPYLNLIYACTVPTVMDPRRGMASHEALSARLQNTDYTKGDNITGPIIQLKALSNEDLVTLLRNITVVCALGDENNMLADENDIIRFLEQQYSTVGAEEKTIREISRAWVTILRTLENDPSLTFDDVVNTVEVKAEKKTSGLGSALDNATPNMSVLGHVDEDDEDDFGF